ncbi:MAG: hypothetical protein WC050_03195 [Candidatus Paceibacterota bacterium]
MIRTILWYLFIGMVLALIVAWFWEGGGYAIARYVRTIPNPVDILWGNSTSTYQITLPWQSAIPQGPDITGLTDQYSDNTDEQNAGTQDGYAPAPSYSGVYGTPSPYHGSVTLRAGTAADSENEYVELMGAGAPLSLQGWSLASAVSGARVYLPLAAHPFILGRVNTVAPVTLSSGESAVVFTERSPVGTSFRENRCTGYLAQLQTFDPSLANNCPSPSEALPTNADTLRSFGSDCIDFVRTLPQCTFPTNIPQRLSTDCREYVTNTFSYNGCVNANISDPTFSSDTWRLYLTSGVELWNNSHDVIRLLDAEGRVVDSVTY